MSMNITQPREAPLAGARVLVTRAAEDAEPLRSRLEALGAEPILFPTLEVQPPRDSEPLDDALLDLERFDWIAFTSRHAVDAVFDRLEVLSLSPSLPDGMQVAAVGASTAQRLITRGVKPAIVPSSDDSRAFGLGEAMRGAGIVGKRVLIPAAELARPELRQVLEASGATVEAVAAYRTGPPRHPDPVILDALCNGGIDVVSFASPSAFYNLADMLGKDLWCLNRALLASIGPTTAAAIRRLGFHSTTSDAPDVTGLIEAIVTAYGERS